MNLAIRIVKDRIQLVNRLELEDYVSGIVEGELGSLNLSPEVLKAQIVVARTYVLSMRGERHQGEGYEFCDHPHCQVYSGIPMNHPIYEKAIQSVRGEYVSYKGRPIAAFYHHSCGGMTSAVQDVWPAPAEPYLRAVKDPAGSSCRVGPKSQWRVSLSKKSLAICFRKAGWMDANKRTISTPYARTRRSIPSGRVQLFLVQSHHPKLVIVTVGRFRNVVNQYYGKEILKSAMFTVSLEDDSFVFKGRGWGHGVGLCQEGAMWMAKHGKTYQQILQHYFPHTQLAKLK